MEDHTAKQTNHTEQVPCPGCGRILALDLNLSFIEEKLYVWFEGLCGECCHKVVDPLPKLRVELNDVVRQIISN